MAVISAKKLLPQKLWTSILVEWGEADYWLPRALELARVCHIFKKATATRREPWLDVFARLEPLFKTTLMRYLPFESRWRSKINDLRSQIDLLRRPGSRQEAVADEAVVLAALWKRYPVPVIRVVSLVDYMACKPLRPIFHVADLSNCCVPLRYAFDIGPILSEAIFRGESGRVLCHVDRSSLSMVSGVPLPKHQLPMQMLGFDLCTWPYELGPCPSRSQSKKKKNPNESSQDDVHRETNHENLIDDAEDDDAEKEDEWRYRLETWGSKLVYWEPKGNPSEPKGNPAEPNKSEKKISEDNITQPKKEEEKEINTKETEKKKQKRYKWPDTPVHPIVEGTIKFFRKRIDKDDPGIKEDSDWPPSNFVFVPTPPEELRRRKERYLKFRAQFFDRLTQSNSSSE